LLDEYAEVKQHVKEEKPYWMNLTGGTRFSGPLRYELENYFPEAHYKLAVDRAVREETGGDRELVPDGGGKGTQYYWADNDGVLYHSEKSDEVVVPFFDSVESAEQFLEGQAEIHGEEQYQGMVLRKTGNRKVKEAVEVLTSQSGLTDW
jgi:hypothetical protein